jgi:predicted dehydrogenase
MALERGIAVFCQKPLGRTAAETRRVVDAARDSDCLLGVDLSYRFISSMKLIKDLVQRQEFGEIFAVDLIFHNAHGPDKAWFYDPELSGGGCIIDLGTHLIDLVLWTLDYPRVRNVSSRLFAKGRGYRRGKGAFVEDYAVAILDLEPATVAHLTCSWKLHAGCDAVIQVSFYGTKGGASLRNVNGSFYDFAAERFLGSRRTPIYPQDSNDTGWDWGRYAATDWTRRLARGEGFDRSAEHFVDVAATIDAIYS